MYIGKTVDLARGFHALKLIQKLKQTAKADTSFGAAILNSINQKHPAVKLIEEIKSQATDNAEAVARCIGEELTQEILKF